MTYEACFQVQYQHLPFSMPDDILSQDMTRISPFCRMLEMCLYRSLVRHAFFHSIDSIIFAEQHASLTDPCTAFEGTIEDVMLVGQIFRIFCYKNGQWPGLRRLRIPVPKRCAPGRRDAEVYEEGNDGYDTKEEGGQALRRGAEHRGEFNLPLPYLVYAEQIRARAS